MAGGAVQRTPYAAVITLLIWADEHLPWVRGKGLMMGVRLLELEAWDALDVIHVLLEEDSIVRSQEEHESKEHVRRIIYGMYGTDNSETRAVRARTNATADGAPMPSAVTKPYIPPSDPSQLAAVLGPPMG